MPTKDKLLGAYYLINNAPLFKVTDKISVIRFLKSLKPLADDFEDYKTVCAEKFRPENYDALLESYNSGDEHAFDTYKQDVSQAISDYLKDETDITISPLTPETVCELCTEQLRSKDVYELIELTCNVTNN